jgi:hypothetical protein
MSQKEVVKYLRVLYLLWFIFGMFSLVYVPSTLIVPANAATTASNIASNEFLFRGGIVGSLITQLIFIFAVLLLYKLFEKVNKTQSLLMVVLALVSVPIAMLNTLNRVAALLSVGNPEQMMFFLNLNAQGQVIASIFWGLWLFPLGYLIYKSKYFPKLVGIAVIMGGIGYVLDFFVKLLLPSLEVLLSISELLVWGEVVFLGWLVIKGAKLSKTKS